MSRPAPIRWRVIVTRYPCEVCQAAPGEPCYTYSGTRKYEPHAPRARLAAANGWRDPDEGAYIGPEGSPLPWSSQ